jgi:hypothetical protein
MEETAMRDATDEELDFLREFLTPSRQGASSSNCCGDTDDFSKEARASGSRRAGAPQSLAHTVDSRSGAAAGRGPENGMLEMRAATREEVEEIRRLQEEDPDGEVHAWSGEAEELPEEEGLAPWCVVPCWS